MLHLQAGVQGRSQATDLPVGSDGFPKENGGVQPPRQNRPLSFAQLCHPEERPQAYATKDLVLTELFLGQRGAITMKSAVNFRIILTKCSVRTF